MERKLPEFAGSYKLGAVISHGSYATICTAEHPQTHEIVAVKLYNRALIQKMGLMKYLELEVRLSERLKHKYLPKIYGTVYDENYIMIIMEYLPNGTLIDLLERGINFPFMDRINVCFKILEGINYLHEKGITHRDIKPENIAFDKNLNPKILDLGLSTEQSQHLRTFCGTPTCMAPEVIRGQPYNGIKADIWSFGVTVHIMMTLSFPYHFTNEAKFVRQIRHGSLEVKNRCFGLMGQVIEKCLQVDPNKRPSAKELLDHMKFLVNDMFTPAAAQDSTLELPKLKIPGKVEKNNCQTGRKPIPQLIVKVSPNFKLRRVCSF